MNFIHRYSFGKKITFFIWLQNIVSVAGGENMTYFKITKYLIKYINIIFMKFAMAFIVIKCRLFFKTQVKKQVFTSYKYLKQQENL